MKTSKVRTILLSAAGLILFFVTFCFGGLYASWRATYSGHAATLIWLAGIDESLEAGNIEQARAATAQAVDAHVGVLRQLDASSSSCLLYLLPWSHGFVDSNNQNIINNAQKYFKEHQAQIRPETREFLAQHANQ